MEDEMTFYRRNIYLIFIISFLLSVIIHCSKRKVNFFTMKKIDAHIHLRYSGPELLDQAVIDNIRVITIMTDHYDLDWQRKFINQQIETHPRQIRYITTFSMKGWDEPDWQERTITHLKKEFENGTVAVKVWKNIGMEFKDKTGNFVMVDNPRFDPIINFIESEGKTLTGHIGEPRDCWLPLDQMMANSNRRYFRNNPQYHMALNPEFPRYEELIKSYENMLEKHPDLKYVGCHMASIEWSLEELANRLNRFPNMAVDLSARIDDVQLLDRDKVRKFFIEYQDRILYGTDLSIKEKYDPVMFAEKAHQVWQRDWIYFSTDSILTIPDIEKPVSGLNLPGLILEKIYRINALKWYPGI
jgi:predicted TIM-barrel fold metal-dependent hydrolase